MAEKVFTRLLWQEWTSDEANWQYLQSAKRELTDAKMTVSRSFALR